MTESYADDNRIHTVYAYDPMGHVTAKASCLLTSSDTCSSVDKFGSPIQYLYNLGGNTSSATNGVSNPGVQFGYDYDSAGHLKQLTSSWTGDALHPSTIFEANSTSPVASYDASGNLRYAQYGIYSGSTSYRFDLNQAFDIRQRIINKIYATGPAN